MDAALYHMQRNHYLGDCLCIVCQPTEAHQLHDALQNRFLVIFLVTRALARDIRTLADLRTLEIFDRDDPILLRIASECLLGTFGDSHCDCESQRLAALRAIQSAGQGVYIHLPQEAQGRGLLYKARELELQVSGRDPNGGSGIYWQCTYRMRINLRSSSSRWLDAP